MLAPSSFVLGGTHPEESSLGGNRNGFRNPGTSAQHDDREEDDPNSSARTKGDEEMRPPVVKKVSLHSFS